MKLVRILYHNIKELRNIKVPYSKSVIEELSNRRRDLGKRVRDKFKFLG
jgi:hypothetical protein